MDARCPACGRALTDSGAFLLDVGRADCSHCGAVDLSRADVECARWAGPDGWGSKYEPEPTRGDDEPIGLEP